LNAIEKISLENQVSIGNKTASLGYKIAIYKITIGTLKQIIVP
jgi:hypothetical protein